MISFLIVFILYTLIDISWVIFVRSVKDDNLIKSMVSSGLIALFSVVSGWLIFVEHSILAGLGCIIGSIFGVYIAYRFSY